LVDVVSCLSSDHHTLGKDLELGEAEINIWQQLQPPGVTSREMPIQLANGAGTLRLRLVWAAGVDSPTVKGSGLKRTSSISSLKGSIKQDSPSRFSMLKRKDTKRDGSTTLDADS
jgi:hypothetical protein